MAVVARLWRRLFYCGMVVLLVVGSFTVSPERLQAAGENMLSNPGFEAGDTGWEKWGSPLIATDVVHSGSKSLYVKRNTGGASASVAVQQGKTYRVGLWVKFAGPGVTDHVIDMDSFGQQQAKERLHFSGSTEWEYQQLLYTPAAGVQHIRISFWNSSSADYYIDDVVIRENVDIERPTKPGVWKTEHEPNALQLTWTGSTDDMGVQSYQLSYKKTDAADWTTVLVPHQASVTEQTYRLENLDRMSVYALMLQAQDEAGNKSDAVLGLEGTPGPNLILNSGFEKNGTLPWIVTGNVSAAAGNPHSGQYAMRLKPQTRADAMVMPADKNTSYLVAYWNRFASQPVPGSYSLTYTFYRQLSLDGFTKLPLSAAASSSWQRSEQQIRSGSGDKIMNLTIKNNSAADLFVDDVFVGKMPELPSGLAPTAPASLTVTGVDGVSAELQWQSSIGPFGIKAYTIAYKKTAADRWENVTVPYIAGQAEYHYRLEGLMPESGYEIEVKAVSEGGNLSAASTVQAVTGKMAPANPHASAEAAALLDRLYSTVGEAVYTGQHNYYEEPSVWYDKAAELTGYYPALWGSDFAYYTGGDFAGLRQTMIDTAIAKGHAGAIVTLTYHEPRPMDAATAGWESVTADVTEAEMTDIVTPGTALYTKWAEQMDGIAGYLQQLRDEGIPVLWRPYHEMNAEFFWWGARPDLFRQLWHNMYDRFTNEYGLDNLIWVWSPNAESSWAYDSAPYYPGHDYVDVLAMDIYNNDYRDTYYNKLVQLSGGRPIAIGESGELPDMDMLREKQPRYVYFMTWSNYLTDKNSNGAIQSAYSHPRALNNGETGNGPYVPPPADSYLIDDFEQYGGSDSSLRSKWQRNSSGNAASVTLDVYHLNSGSYGLKLDYTVGNPGYAGMYRSMGKEWPGMEGIEFWLQSDGSNRQLAVQFHETNGEVWEAGYRLSGTEPLLVRIPFTAFERPGWSTGGNGVIDLGSIKEFAFYIAQGNGVQGSGTLYIDDIQAVKGF